MFYYANIAAMYDKENILPYWLFLQSVGSDIENQIN